MLILQICNSDSTRVASNSRMTGELNGMDVEGSGSWPNLRYHPGIGHTEKTQSQSVCRPRFQPRTSRMKVRHVLSLTNLLGILVSPTDETDI
jgi:hypothetical protein